MEGRWHRTHVAAVRRRLRTLNSAPLTEHVVDGNVDDRLICATHRLGCERMILDRPRAGQLGALFEPGRGPGRSVADVAE